MFQNQSDEEDDTFDQVSSMADRLGLKGADRQSYIHDHMTQLGYDAMQTRESYLKRPEEPEDQQSGGSRWFGGGGRQQGGRQQSGRQQSGRRGDDGDSF